MSTAVRASRQASSARSPASLSGLGEGVELSELMGSGLSELSEGGDASADATAADDSSADDASADDASGDAPGDADDADDTPAFGAPVDAPTSPTT